MIVMARKKSSCSSKVFKFLGLLAIIVVIVLSIDSFTNTASKTSNSAAPSNTSTQKITTAKITNTPTPTSTKKTTPKPTNKPTATPVKKSQSERTYILNKNTKKFHYTDCSSVKLMNESNKKTYVGTRNEVISMGYVPCKNCNP